MTRLGSQKVLEGLAHAEWDAACNTFVLTDQDQEGGAMATGWMQRLVNGLQELLTQHQGATGKSAYALIPNLLPAIGYQYDPDGFNYGSASGHMYLKWTDARGNSQTRYYDGAGNRADATGESLAGDFMVPRPAVVSARQVQAVLAHWQGSRVSEGGLPK